MGRRVRRATPEDATRIARVHVRAWQVAYRGLVPDEELAGLSVPRRAAWWVDRLAGTAPPSFTLVLDDEGAVAGFCSIVAPARDADVGARSCEVAALYVDPVRWRSGAGSALLEHALARVGDSWDEVVLWVFRDSRRARSFYARHGFVPDGSVRREGDRAAPEIRLRRAQGVRLPRPARRP